MNLSNATVDFLNLYMNLYIFKFVLNTYKSNWKSIYLWIYIHLQLHIYLCIQSKCNFISSTQSDILQHFLFPQYIFVAWVTQAADFICSK